MRPPELNESERRQLESILDRPEAIAALERLCEIEAFAWRTRLVNDALSITTDPIAKVCKQSEFAARAKQLEEFVGLLKRKVLQRGLEAVDSR